MKNVVIRALAAQKKLFILIIPVLLGLTACNKLTVEKAESVVMQGEKDRIPLLVQSMPLVNDITVDSIRIIVEDEPMDAYLYTTWTGEGMEIPVIVQVTNIHQSDTHKGYVEWMTDWESAARAFVVKSLDF